MDDKPIVAVYRRRNRILAEFGRDALQSTGLQELLDQAVLRSAQAADVSHAKILQYRAETADLLVVAGYGWHPGVVGHARLRADVASPAGATLQTAQPVSIDDWTEAQTFRIPALLAEHDIVSMSNVPILANGKVWGVLEVDSDKPRHFTDEDTDFLNAFAGFLGAAIHRASLEADTQSLASGQAAAVMQTDILLRELQHRMKNNLQTILSVINLQKRKILSIEAKRALDHIAGRVTAISLAQDQLSLSQRLRSVRLGAYLRALCAYMETERDDIVIETKADDLEVAIDQAVPAGLIVNEAVTNAIKHAFPGRAGSIRVEFSADSVSRRGTLIIADDGIGTQSPPRSEGSGLDLMTALATQLGGELTRHSAEATGTTVSVVFPLRL
jgi:two-component sensor histidine kinase